MLNRACRLSLSFCLCILMAVHARAADPVPDDFNGWIISVLDGDTVRILDAGNRVVVLRIQSINAPELDQPYGDQSRKHLSSLLAGKEVSVDVGKRDGTEQVIGRVRVRPADCLDCKHSVDVGLAQVQGGMAWWTRKFRKEQKKKDRHRYESAQAEAQKARLGLWADPEPVPPWEWPSPSD